MVIHDTYLAQIEELIKNKGKTIDIVKTSWKTQKISDYIMDSETMVELGSATKKNASLTLCTSEKDFEDEIILIGEDLQKLSGKIQTFSKVIEVSLKDEEDENALYKTIRSISRARLGINLKGTMLKATSSEELECFRISKSAYKAGINFSVIGSALIERIKIFDEVKNVRVYYIINNEELNNQLLEYSTKITQVTDAMNHIFDGIELDCGSCAIKEVCDEVEGMRDSHKKMYNR